MLFNQPKQIQFNRDNLYKYDDITILAAIAEHECLNLSKAERHLVMEAVWNRCLDDYNCNGTNIQNQLLANKQFTGLFKYRPKDFSFDINNPRHQENLIMAYNIVYHNMRYSSKRIYYWTDSINKKCKHYKYVTKHRISTLFKTKQIFS